MTERLSYPSRSRPTRTVAASETGKHHKERTSSRQASTLQTSFLAPDEATLYADLVRLRLVSNELTTRYLPTVQRVSQYQDLLIRSPKDVADLLMPEMQALPHEEFRTLLLSSKNAVLDIPTLYKGTLNSSPIRIAEVFKPAILANAASLIAVHCHPSGAPRSV